jgi:putative membrane protein
MNMITTPRLLTATAGIAATSTALAQSGPSGTWNHPGMMWGGAWFMGPLMMLLFLVIVVAVVVFVVRSVSGSGSETGAAPHRPSASARTILEERFARGEIDEDEFRKRKKALEE